MCEIFSKLTIKTPEQRQRRRSGVFLLPSTLLIRIFSDGKNVPL